MKELFAQINPTVLQMWSVCACVCVCVCVDPAGSPEDNIFSCVSLANKHISSVSWRSVVIKLNRRVRVFATTWKNRAALSGKWRDVLFSHLQPPLAHKHRRIIWSAENEPCKIMPPCTCVNRVTKCLMISDPGPQNSHKCLFNFSILKFIYHMEAEWISFPMM